MVMSKMVPGSALLQGISGVGDSTGGRVRSIVGAEVKVLSNGSVLVITGTATGGIWVTCPAVACSSASSVGVVVGRDIRTHPARTTEKRINNSFFIII
jgi:hypothetical protein